MNNSSFFFSRFDPELFLFIGTIITPDKYLGSIMSLCMERRGIQKNAINIDNDRIMLQYELPLCEIIVDFHDSLKTLSSGYASFDYEDSGYKSSSLVKVTNRASITQTKLIFIYSQLCILLNGVAVDELSSIVHISRAQTIGKKMCLRLKEIIPRQLVQIAIQAEVKGKILGRETLKAYRKDVTAKLVNIIE